MNDLKKIISKNITNLRKEKKLTQFEFAGKLNYSDKAISKWERGESIPDVITIKQIADFFSVTVDYMLTDHTNETLSAEKDVQKTASNKNENIKADEITHEKSATERMSLTDSLTQNNGEKDIENMLFPNRKTTKHNLNTLPLTLLSVTPVWIIATLIFTLIAIFTGDYVWYIFYIAVPITMLLFIIFNSIWGNRRNNYYIISVFIWSILFCLYFTLYQYRIWQIFFLGVPAQITIYLWSKLKK